MDPPCISHTSIVNYFSNNLTHILNKYRITLLDERWGIGILIVKQIILN